MKSFKSFRKKRAVTPIVATLLMFTLTFAAIGISLIYMVPTIELFKDNSVNNSTKLYFFTLDATIQDLAKKQPPASNDMRFYQDRGELYYDDQWRVIFFFSDINKQRSLSVLDEQYGRIVHRNTNTGGYEPGENSYHIGPQDQNYVFLNGSKLLFNDISVLNESRTIFDSVYLYISLSYRYVLQTSYTTVGDKEIFTLDIIHLKLNLIEDSRTDIKQSPTNIFLKYNETEKITLPAFDFNYDLRAEAWIINEYGYFNKEYPLYYPINPYYTEHQLVVNIYNVHINLSFS